MSDKKIIKMGFEMGMKTSVEDANARKLQREAMHPQGAIKPLKTNEAKKSIDKITRKIG